MNCPKCKSDMSPVQFQGVTIDRCESCHGLWFDENELKKFLSKKDSERIDIGDHADYEKSDSIVDYACPRCQNRMVKMVHNQQSHIWYEACGNCFGLFLDATELTDLKKHTLNDFITDLFVNERKA